MRSSHFLLPILLSAAFTAHAQPAPPDVSRWSLPEYKPEFFQGKSAAGQEAFEFWLQSASFRDNVRNEKPQRSLLENLLSGDAKLVASANREIAGTCRRALADMPKFRLKGARSIHLLIILHLRASHTLTPETKALLEQTVRESDVSHIDNNFDNWIEIPGANGVNVHGHLTPLLLAPEVVPNERARRLGYWGMRRELDHLNTTGDVGEFNLMENHFNGITDWEMIKLYTSDLHLRRMATMIAERAWINRYLTWSAATERNTGPGSRMAPSQWLGADSERFLFAMTTDKPIWLNMFFPWDGDGALKFRSVWPLNQAQAMVPDLPPYLQSLAWNKSLPNELQANLTYLPHENYPKLPDVVDGDPLAPKKYVNYQTTDYALGSSTASWVVNTCYVAAAAFWNNSRNPSAPLGSPERFCALYPHYVVNGMSFLDDGDLYFQSKPNEPLTDNRGGPSGPWLREFIEFGRLATLQHKNTFISSYTSKPGTHRDLLVKDKVKRASAGMFLMRWTEGTEGLFINRKPVTSLPAELAPGDWWFIEDGNVYAAVRPLEATKLGGPCKTILEKRTRHVVLYQDNFVGESIEGISDKDWVQARSGFVVEMGDEKEYGSFKEFQDRILESKVTVDKVDGYQRDVAYERKGRSLDMSWHCYQEEYARRNIDGQEDPWVKHLSSPEFAITESGEVKVPDATLTTTAGKTAWLLSSPPSKTWVGYQPNAEEEHPVKLVTPAGTISATKFPFGKIIVSQKDDKTLLCQIDATYRPFFSQTARAPLFQARGTLPSEIIVTPKEPGVNVKAILNGRPILIEKRKDGTVAINPYRDTKAVQEDAGFMPQPDVASEGADKDE